MMKILLVNAPVFFNKFENSQAPLGIAYVAASLLKNGFTDIKLKDYEVEPYSDDEFLGLVREFSPDVIGLSCRTASYPSAVKLINLLRKDNVTAKLVIGGHHATALTENVLRETGVDIVVRHEGEVTFPELVDVLGKGADIEKVKGIAYLRDGKVVHTPNRELVDNLDLLPFPARELLPMDKYAYGVLLSSRGCPFKCVYCDKNISTRNVRYRSVDNVLDEIEEVVLKWKEDRIYFIDDHFLLNKKRFFEITNGWMKRGLKFEWLCQARVDAADEEILRQAKKSGCISIIYGVESGDPVELEFLSKGGGCTLEQGERAIRLTKEAGIACRVNFMLGFPVSTHETVRNSIRYAKKLNADNYRFFHVVPLPNTPLWDRCVKDGIVTDNMDWSRFNFNEAMIATNDLSLDDLQIYGAAAYLHVFKWKVLREFTLTLIPNFLKFIKELPKRKKVASALFYSFPAFANMASQIWFQMARKDFKGKLKFIKDIIVIERSL